MNFTPLAKRLRLFSSRGGPLGTNLFQYATRTQLMVFAVFATLADTDCLESYFCYLVTWVYVTQSQWQPPFWALVSAQRCENTAVYTIEVVNACTCSSNQPSPRYFRQTLSASLCLLSAFPVWLQNSGDIGFSLLQFFVGRPENATVLSPLRRSHV